MQEFVSSVSRRDLLRKAIATAAAAGHVEADEPKPVELTPAATNGFLAARLPFSRYGSYWAISKLWWDFGASKDVALNGWYVRILQDEATPSELFRIELVVRGQPQPFEGELKPESLTLSSVDGSLVEFVLAEGRLLRVRGRGCALRLRAITGPYSYAIQESARSCEVASVNIPRVEVRASTGNFRFSAQWVDELQKASCSSVSVELSPDDRGVFEGSLEHYDAVPSSRSPTGTFDEARAGAKQEFDRWAGALMPLAEPYEKRRELAAWVLWSSTVAPRGLYDTPVVWCSKSWMNRIWSWDHCFVAVGLAPALPEFAWQQLMIFARMQDSDSGMLADSMNNVQRSWLCTKPPIHGWALAHLMRSMKLSRAQLDEVYEPLRRWTNFWLLHRNLDGDGLPCILNANESFDNTTANTLFGPVKAPEIAAYLVLQMGALENVARELKHETDARDWHDKSQKMIDALLKILWDEQAGSFKARRTGDGKSGEGDCVFSYVPIVLGRRLPDRIVRQMTAALAQPGRFLTRYGVASEALNSPRYEPRSYVKGPVWAPPCTFIAEGLDAVGEKALASQIRRGFMDACLQHGMSEHFDAQSGEPAGDPGYNWTAAMYLHFGREEGLARRA